MLLVPYLTAMFAFPGAVSPQTLFGMVGVLLLFFSRPPLMLLLKRKVIDGGFGPGSRTLWLNFGIFAGTALAVFSLLTVVHGLWQLPLLGGISLVLFVLHTAQALRRRERTITGEFLGIITLTITAPLAAYLGCGKLLSREAGMLWVLNALYFGASVYFIKMFMRASAHRGGSLGWGRKFSLGKKSLIYNAFMAALLAGLTAAAWIPPYAFVAFVPIFIHITRSVLTLRPTQNLKVEGFVQAGLSLVFAALLAASYRL